MLSRAQKVAESLFAKYIRIALAIFRKFDDSFSYAAAGVKTAPVSLNSLASHFECNAHDPRRFRVKLLVAEEWCDWRDPIRSPCHSTKRERQSRFRQLRADNGPNSRLDQGEVHSRRAGMLLGGSAGLLMIRPAYYMTRTSRDAPAAFGARQGCYD